MYQTELLALAVLILLRYHSRIIHTYNTIIRRIAV